MVIAQLGIHAISPSKASAVVMTISATIVLAAIAPAAIATRDSEFETLRSEGAKLKVINSDRPVENREV